MIEKKLKLKDIKVGNVFKFNWGLRGEKNENDFSIVEITEINKGYITFIQLEDDGADKKGYKYEETKERVLNDSYSLLPNYKIN